MASSELVRKPAARSRKTERARLQADHQRARRVLADIDRATADTHPRTDMRISAQQRQHNEARIRAAMDRLLRGDLPTGGSCDVKTLAREAGVDRTAFYSARPYAHLRKEFEGPRIFRTRNPLRFSSGREVRHVEQAPFIHS